MHGKWTRMVDVPHVGERKYSFRYRGARKPRGIVSLLIGSKKIVSLLIYNYFLFPLNASVSTLTMKGAKHGTCWMSHTSAKGVGHEQCGRAQRKKQHGRASPLLPLLGRRPHVVVLSGMNDTKCDMERKTHLVGSSRGIKIGRASCRERV